MLGCMDYGEDRQKSAHGDGGYRRKRGGFEIRLWIDGRRVSRWARTEREAKRLLAELRQTRAAGGSVEDARITVAEYLVQWLASARPSLSARTYDRYEQLVRLHLAPAFKRRRLIDLRPQQVDALYAAKRESLSETTVHHLHACLHTALAQAVRWEIVERNVCDLVRSPRVERYTATVLSREQGRQLLAAARGDRLEALYVLALTTGMREGELLGLKWAHVDLDAGLLWVRTALSTPKGGATLKSPKNTSSARAVPLISITAAALERHRHRQAEERLAAGDRWQERGLVFANSVGGFILPGNLLRRGFRPLLERAGLPQVRVHDLRHSLSTGLQDSGSRPRTVAALLGHARETTTSEHYTHATPAILPQIRAELEAHFEAIGGRMGEKAAGGTDTA